MTPTVDLSNVGSLTVVRHDYVGQPYNAGADSSSRRHRVDFGVYVSGASSRHGADWLGHYRIRFVNLALQNAVYCVFNEDQLLLYAFLLPVLARGV